MTRVWARRAGVPVVFAILVVAGTVLQNGRQRIGRPFPGFLTYRNGIVSFLGQAGWSIETKPRILFAQLLGTEKPSVPDEPVEIQSHVARFRVGTSITYRFRREADVFTASLPSNRFGIKDYAAVHGGFATAGLCFALAGLWGLWRRRHPPPAAIAFFLYCQTIALGLVTAADAYGPYRFLSIHLAAVCFAPAALFHLASSFPEPMEHGSRWRTLLLAVMYAGAALFAAALHLAEPTPSLFVPLLYTVYLLFANVLFLYLVRLILNLWSARDAALRASLRQALAGLLLCGLAESILLAIYLTAHRPIPPLAITGPLPLFPILTAMALRHGTRTPEKSRTPPVRLRLSFLFLDAVQTALLIGISVFWLNNNWHRLLDDQTLNQRQQARVQQFLDHRPRGRTTRALAAIDALALTTHEHTLVGMARTALAGDNAAGARTAIRRLKVRYQNRTRALRRRETWIGHLGWALVAAVVIVGFLQAGAFLAAVQRWFVRPIEQLADATKVIATGNVGYRVPLESIGDEFADLGRAISAMAASLFAIQQRIIAEREARHEAAGSARDAERRRLARELHDGTLQDLGAVKLVLERERKRFPDTEIQPAIESIIGILTDLRRLVDDLRAPDLSNLSIAEAIGEHARILTHGRGIALDIALPDQIGISDWAVRDVYRIAQEAIANAVRHGLPDRLSIRLVEENDGVIFEISDDGAGFDPQRTAVGGGLRGMRERATVLGAQLDIITAPGAGTRIRLAMPTIKHGTTHKGTVPDS